MQPSSGAIDKPQCIKTIMAAAKEQAGLDFVNRKYKLCCEFELKQKNKSNKSNQ